MGMTESVITIIIATVMLVVTLYVGAAMGDKLVESVNAAGMPLPEGLTTAVASLPTLMNVLITVAVITMFFAIFYSFTTHGSPRRDRYSSGERDQQTEIQTGQVVNPTFVHNNRDTVVYGNIDYGGGSGAVHGALQSGGQHVQRTHIPDGWEPVEAPQTATPVSTTHPVDTTTETHNKHEPKRTRYNTIFDEDTDIK